MISDWNTSSPDVKGFVKKLKRGMKQLLIEEIIGFYIHGSLAMGGFNPSHSDIDILVVTKEKLTVQTKRDLAKLLLSYSNSPFPIEISFLNRGQLESWQHPCPFDFHYSEFWRERYEADFWNHTDNYINDAQNTDADLAAHITVTYHRGICLEGKPIKEVFPVIPTSDYLSSIFDDFEDCLTNITADPVYCILNMIRVYWYITEEVISSKLEAGNWGLRTFPIELRTTIHKAVKAYGGTKKVEFLETELQVFRKYIVEHVKSYGQ
ncbi:streptomycin 3-adenylyltransferase [Oceanobacillus limi]|uniref:Spectinomycin 9-adenylyltransferase n=1 Tax=Oceanobacillus limi TaxID=930131 RepID=A0A1I0GJJ2_9BACI|nr:aminoglycoside adenylyltransferase domain-containing protein [Oceanobacillus limi]SET71113.1 streptomycin 3-adenylyltransferase [Oceanobacillus limi]